MQLTEITYTEVYNYFQEQFKNNLEFREEINELYLFYRRKLLLHAKQNHQQDLIEYDFEEVVKSTIFNGYYIMKLILSDKDTVLSDDDWMLNPGTARNEIPKFLKSINNDNALDWKTEINHRFSMEVLNSIESAYDLTKSLIREIAEYGAFKAFIEDTRYKGSINSEESSLLLGNSNDLYFLSPQVYTVPSFVTLQHEIWDLFFWSSLNKEDWVGTVHLSKLPTDEDKLIYLIEFNISDLIMEAEKMEIIEKMVSNLPLEIRSALQIRLYNVSQLDLVSTVSNV